MNNFQREFLHKTKAQNPLTQHPEINFCGNRNKPFQKKDSQTEFHFPIMKLAVQPFPTQTDWESE